MSLDSKILLDGVDTIINILAFVGASFVLYQKVDKRLTRNEDRQQEMYDEMHGNGFLKRKEFEDIVKARLETANEIHKRIENKVDMIEKDCKYGKGQ